MKNLKIESAHSITLPWTFITQCHMVVMNVHYTTFVHFSLQHLFKVISIIWFILHVSVIASHPPGECLIIWFTNLQYLFWMEGSIKPQINLFFYKSLNEISRSPQQLFQKEQMWQTTVHCAWRYKFITTLCIAIKRKLTQFHVHAVVHLMISLSFRHCLC